MDADSCSTCNIMGINHFKKIQERSERKIDLQTADNKVYGFAAEKPVELKGKFTAEIQYGDW